MNVISFIKKIVEKDTLVPTQDQVKKVIGQLATLGIKAHYDAPSADPEAPSRMLLFSSRYNSRNYKYASECNGLIVDYRQWTVICQPPALPNAHFSVKNVADHFDQYDVYHLQDGTVVNLYYYQDEWRISTARGLDMGKMEWCGVAYKTALDDAWMATCDNHVFTGLQKDQTYTVGFTHKAMHYTKQNQIWSIRGEIEGVPKQTRCTTYDTFEAVQAACDSTKDWGFMLRSRNEEVTGTDSTILLESRRMHAVRTLVYDRHFREAATVLGFTPEEWAFGNCLIDENGRENYLMLYPDHENTQKAAIDELLRMSTLVVAPPVKDEPVPVTWFRQHVIMPGQTVDQVFQSMLSRDKIIVWLRHLRSTGRVPGVAAAASSPQADA